MEAVKQIGMALQWVEEQTPELCIEAVKQDGRALQFVEDKSMLKSPEHRTQHKSATMSAF